MLDSTSDRQEDAGIDFRAVNTDPDVKIGSIPDNKHAAPPAQTSVNTDVEALQDHNFCQLSAGIDSFLKNAKPFVFYVNTTGMELKPLGVFAAITIWEIQSAISGHHAAELREQAELAMLSASNDNSRTNKVSEADIRKQQTAATMLAAFRGDEIKKETPLTIIF